jgi:predicted nucleic acid-binding protein
MPGVLIDTDVCIDFLRGEAYAKPLLAGMLQNGSAVISVLTLYELLAGMRDREKQPTTNFTDACLIEQVSPEIAVKGGELYRK